MINFDVLWKCSCKKVIFWDVVCKLNTFPFCLPIKITSTDLSECQFEKWISQFDETVDFMGDFLLLKTKSTFNSFVSLKVVAKSWEITLWPGQAFDAWFSPSLS